MASPTTSVPCVLVIDDEELVLSFLSLALKEYGYRVVASRSAANALEQLKNSTEHVAVALIDLSNGHKDLIAIRERWQTLPVLVMISDLGTTEETRLRELGACAVLQKPFSLSNVLDALRNAVQRNPVADEPFRLL